MKKHLLRLGLLSLCLSACTADRELPPIQPESPTPQGVGQSDDARLRAMGAEQGIAYIRLSKRATNQERALQGVASEVLRSLGSELGEGLRSAQVSDLEPLFPIDKRFELRMRAAGLDQWYIVRFDSKASLSKTLNALGAIPDVEHVEPSYATSLPKVKFSPKPMALTPTEDPDALPFDDPELIAQWHYRNFGFTENSEAGADINLYEAWRITTGKPNVIVAVQDGGLDVEHPDLVDNLWVNEAELNGTPGVDDDDNGVVDDIHGYNSIHGNGNLYPDPVSHGTHVAGTVGARNNNGIGVGGVAGGDGSPNSGARIMGVQVFGRARERGNHPNAMVYSANNGAVISQNSWGYEYPGPSDMPEHIKVAIDYFIQYAGCDAAGNQRPDSPMKGGVVLFAAGNDNKDYLAWPGAYSEVIAVSAMAPDWKRAKYTNRGDWVDIMAPGGDEDYAEGMVYSTVSPKVYEDMEYGYMQGTSMACPHVSGVAALIVSHYGGQGFTNTELKKRLMAALRPMNIDRRNPAEAGRLGRGYLDAGRAFASDSGKAPAKVSAIRVDETSFLYAVVSWDAVADEDDETATEYEIHVSESALTEQNYQDKLYGRVNSIGVPVGEALQSRILKLDDDTDYYVGVVAVDRWGNRSALTSTRLRTLKNNAPALALSTSDPIRVMAQRKQTFSVTASDVDGHEISLRVTGDSRGVAYNIDGNAVHFTLSAVAAPGHYAVQVIARDELGAESTLEVPFEVFRYTAPTFSETISNYTIGVGKSKSLDLSQLVSNPSDVALSYSVEGSDASTATAVVDEAGKVSLSGVAQGAARVRLVVKDEFGAELSMSLQVQVVADESHLVHALYPTPAKRTLYLLLNSEAGSVQVDIVSALGVKVFSQSFRPDKTGLVRIPVQRFSPGSYRLEATDSNGVKTSRTFSKI